MDTVKKEKPYKMKQKHQEKLLKGTAHQNHNEIPLPSHQD